MYWSIIDEKRNELLKRITEMVSIPEYYMIGGTALSLQLGLRLSYDFDFCVPQQFNNEILLEELSKVGEVDVKQNQTGTCDVMIDGIQISFFYYPNAVINEYVTTQDMPKLRLASVLDIAIMKVVAIGGRGAKKDFFDLYNIMKNTNVAIEDLANGLVKKCGKRVNYANVIMGLSYFEDAEQEILPKTLIEYDWEEIKQFFIEFQEEFREKLEVMEI